MEQQDLNKRLLLALALSFFVFIGYSYFFPPVKPTQQDTTQTTAATHQTPTVETASNTATPSVATNTSSAAPVVAASPTLVSVKADHYLISIDEFGRIAQMELLESKYHDDEVVRFYSHQTC